MLQFNMEMHSGTVCTTVPASPHHFANLMQMFLLQAAFNQIQSLEDEVTRCKAAQKILEDKTARFEEIQKSLEDRITRCERVRTI